MHKENRRAFKERAHRGELLRRDVDREPVSHDVNRAQVQKIMRTLNALVTAHISHLTAEQTIRSSNLAILLDEAITTVIPDGSEDDFQHVGGRAMMAVRIKGGSGQDEDDNSEDERPSMVLRNQKGSAEGVIPISLSAEEDVTDYEPPRLPIQTTTKLLPKDNR